MGSFEVGVPSFGVPLSKIPRESNAQPLTRFAKERGLDFLALMSSFDGPDNGLFQRELAIFVPSSSADCNSNERFNIAERAIKFLNENGLALDKIAQEEAPNPDDDTSSFYAAYRQRDVTASRKQVQPLLLKFFESIQMSTSKANL